MNPGTRRNELHLLHDPLAPRGEEWSGEKVWSGGGWLVRVRLSRSVCATLCLYAWRVSVVCMWVYAGEEKSWISSMGLPLGIHREKDRLENLVCVCACAQSLRTNTNTKKKSKNNDNSRAGETADTPAPCGVPDAALGKASRHQEDAKDTIRETRQSRPQNGNEMLGATMVPGPSLHRQMQRRFLRDFDCGLANWGIFPDVAETRVPCRSRTAMGRL